MPRYEYWCEDCSRFLEVVHSYRDKLKKCSNCKSEGITRVLNTPVRRLRAKLPTSAKPGDEVNRSIAEAHEDIHNQRKELEKKRITK